MSDDQTSDWNKFLHSMEQGRALMTHNLPPLWRQLYLRTVEEGFTEIQAFQILLTFVHSNAGGKYTC